MTTDDLIKDYDPLKEPVVRIVNDIKEVSQHVSEVTGVPWRSILTRGRQPEFAIPRMILFSILANRRVYSDIYTPGNLGRATKRNHATFHHARKAMKERYGIRGFEELTKWIDELESKHGHVAVIKD